jgi:hypothetical protein
MSEADVSPFALRVDEVTKRHNRSSETNPLKIQRILTRKPHLETMECVVGLVLSIRSLFPLTIGKTYSSITRVLSSSIYLYNCSVICNDGGNAEKEKNDVSRRHKFFRFDWLNKSLHRIYPQIGRYGEAHLKDGTHIHTVTTDCYMEGILNIDTEVYRFDGPLQYKLQSESNECIVTSSGRPTKHCFFPSVLTKYIVPYNVFIVNDEVYAYVYEEGDFTYVYHLQSMSLACTFPFKVVDILMSEGLMYMLTETELRIYSCELTFPLWEGR